MNVMDLPATETFEQKRDRLLIAWKIRKQIATAEAAAEKVLRQEICEHLFPGNTTEGTHRYELGNGYSVKYVYKNNYAIERDVDKVDAAAEVMAKMGPTAAVIAERLLKWSADLSISEYRILTDRAAKYANDPNAFPEYATESRVLRELNGILTIKPASPTLELEEPKEGKKR